MSFLRVENDPENRKLFEGMPALFARGHQCVTHLGQEFRVRDGRICVETYLPATAIVDGPNEKGACNISLVVRNLRTENRRSPVIRGQAKVSPRSNEAICYFFLDENPFKAVVSRFRTLLKTGKVTREDLKGVLTLRELEAL